jgi:hypothetical protein
MDRGRPQAKRAGRWRMVEGRAPLARDARSRARRCSRLAAGGLAGSRRTLGARHDREAVGSTRDGVGGTLGARHDREAVALTRDGAGGLGPYRAAIFT